jgi:predicted transposase YdaD
MEMSDDEIIRRQKESWDKARWDEEARYRLNRTEGEARGRAEGRAEIAVNMRRERLAVSIIAKVTGLTIAEIEALPIE